MTIFGLAKPTMFGSDGQAKPGLAHFADADRQNFGRFKMVLNGCNYFYIKSIALSVFTFAFLQPRQLISSETRLISLHTSVIYYSSTSIAPSNYRVLLGVT